MLGCVPKEKLPTYNVFDERRHFEPGPDVAKVLRIGGTQVGLLVCEDIWEPEPAQLARSLAIYHGRPWRLAVMALGFAPAMALAASRISTKGLRK